MVAARSRTIKKRKMPPFTRAFSRVSAQQMRGRVAGAQEELKFFDIDGGNAAVPTTATISSLNLIPQGVTESTRVGRKCVIKRVNVKGNILLQTTTSVASGQQRMRIMLLLDKQANGALPALATVLSNSDVRSYRTLSESNRFQVLSDKTVDLNYTAGEATGGFQETTTSFNINKPCNVPIEFNSTTGAITEIRSNNLVLLRISEAAAPAVNLSFRARVRFSDN